MNYLKLTSDRLEVGALNDQVADEGCGAISLFVGTTRDYFEDKTVLCLEYEAYEAMALKSMNSICTDIRQRWKDVKHIGIHHRLGIVPVKEASVVIAISSPHRKASLQAVAFAIEELKKSVPVWKKETYSEPAAINKRKATNTIGNATKKPFNFNECKVQDTLQIPKGLIQISADSSEIERRLTCFVEKKREEIDHNNIQDFIVRSEAQSVTDPTTTTDEFSCARVNSIIFRQKDSKGHLRVHRVKNEHGPQIEYNYKGALDKLTDTKPRRVGGDLIAGFSVDGVEERLQNVETHLRVANVKASIFERLKAVEDKILQLETISPEYVHFIEQTPRPDRPMPQKIVYSNEEVDDLIERLQAQVDGKV